MSTHATFGHDRRRVARGTPARARCTPARRRRRAAPRPRTAARPSSPRRAPTYSPPTPGVSTISSPPASTGRGSRPRRGSSPRRLPGLPCSQTWSASSSAGIVDPLAVGPDRATMSHGVGVPHDGRHRRRDVVEGRADRRADQAVDQQALALLELADHQHAGAAVEQPGAGRRPGARRGRGGRSGRWRRRPARPPPPVRCVTAHLTRPGVGVVGGRVVEPGRPPSSSTGSSAGSSARVPSTGSSTSAGPETAAGVVGRAGRRRRPGRGGGRRRGAALGVGGDRRSRRRRWRRRPPLTSLSWIATTSLSELNESSASIVTSSSETVTSLSWIAVHGR